MRMPTTARSSVTTTEPICWLFISEVASVSEASAGQVIGGDDISSCTAVDMVPLLGSSRPCHLARVPGSASVQCDARRPVL